jgi:ankyrin repeat protein
MAPVREQETCEKKSLNRAVWYGEILFSFLLIVATMLVLVRVWNISQQTVLFYATSRGDTETVTRELDRDPKAVNLRYSGGWSLLHTAAFKGHLALATLLIERGIPVDAETRYTQTPLHMAAQCDKIDAARLLISKGADINKKDRGGSTPLALAKRNEKKEMVEFLVNHGGKE